MIMGYQQDWVKRERKFFLLAALFLAVVFVIAMIQICHPLWHERDLQSLAFDHLFTDLASAFSGISTDHSTDSQTVPC